MSDCTPESPKKFEVVKFLLERSHTEAQIFWQRNNFMFLANTTLIGAVFFAFYANSSHAKDYEAVRPIVGCSGIFITIIWLLFNKVGRRMNHAYMEDAKRVANQDEVLKSYFANSLGRSTPSEAIEKAGQPLIQKAAVLSATMVNYFFILGFLAAWLFVLLRPIQ
jgi:hypothetical protein